VSLRPFHEMPRPRHHAWLGNFPEWIGMEQGRRVLQRLERYALECGPLARVPLGPTSIVAISDTELVADLLAREEANYKGWTYILTRAVMHNVLLLNGEPWAHGRRMYRNALRGADMVSSADACAQLHLAHALRPSASPRAIDVGHVAHRLVGDTVAHFVARTRIDDALDIDRARVQYELAAVGMDLQCQPWAYLWPRRWTALRASMSRLRAHFRGLVEARKAAPIDVPDVLGGVLELAGSGGHAESSSDIADTLVAIYFTAHDVLAASTGWCLWLLARHPEVQTRLRAELHALGRAPTAAQLIGVDYLGMVVKEALRLYPGYALFGRNPQRPLQLAGYDVPRSALLIVSPYVIHRLPRYWSRPNVFDPQRWQHDPHGVPPPRPDHGYLPFGAGHRACLASRLAFPTMKLLVARLVEAVELRARMDHEPLLGYCGTLFSDNGLPAELRALPS
jgi:cytochrome P450